MRNAGAARVLGLDCGAASVAYAQAAADRLNSDGVEFEVRSVYETGAATESFDFAIQNGVFHHLESEDRAYEEAIRILRPGAWMWIYTDGTDHAVGDIQDTASAILRSAPADEVLHCLDSMHLQVGKRYHLGDDLNAVYRHTNFQDFVERLESYGFDDFKRLTGRLSTDFDPDVIQSDPWGRERFGEGDIRVLARKAA